MLGEAINGRTDVWLPCTVVTSCGNVREMHLTGICSALLAVRTEHQYGLSMRYSGRAWEQGIREWQEQIVFCDGNREICVMGYWNL